MPLIPFVCPECDEVLEALPSAELWHRCPSPVTGKPGMGPRRKLRPNPPQETP